MFFMRTRCTVMYRESRELLLVLIPAGSISQELRATAWMVTLSTLAMGNVAFLLYDRALHNLLMLYRLVWQPKLHRMLGMH